MFNRTTRSVTLTEAGAQLYARVAPAFRDIDDALDDLNNFRGTPTGTLRINAARSSAEMVLRPIVSRFVAAYPQVRVDIVISNGLIDLVSGGFDAGVRFGETIAQGMIAVPIGPRQRSAVVASPDFLARHRVPLHPQDLKTLPCIRLRFESGRYYAWEFERNGIDLAVEVDGPLSMNDQSLMIEAALDGVGLAYAFEGQVADLVAAGRLMRVLEDWCPPYNGFHLYYPSRRQLPAAVRAFIDFCSEQ
ncbi:DNA-binding transcriptional LysR family regulator [Novosphingobium sp. SG916]|nr:DNA-binding transcriptional LysR family regulator [Novosphingobium sp. SG720]NMN05020.1 DNA-binding transcriptional LysR family regulator [Novosphingobium sp. SG919]NMN87314.1 DNA-binding transcriptional LysR family regulator [Novosphingobium sp. SG916]